MDESPETVREASAFLVLGFISARDLPQWAWNYLDAATESAQLIELAISRPKQEKSNRALFDEIAVCEGICELSIEDALMTYARFIARNLIAGNVTPFVGANLIWSAEVGSGLKDFHRLDGFIYAASCEPIDDDLLYANFESAILNEARAILPDPLLNAVP